jgi:hypothetical protein
LQYEVVEGFGVRKVLKTEGATRFFWQLDEPPKLGLAFVREFGEAARVPRQLDEPPKHGVA